MARGHVKQHYVAQSYLLAWRDPETPTGHEPYVWAFPAEGGEPKRKAPKKLFYEIEMYTRSVVKPGLPVGRDLGIERELNRIEGAFVKARRQYVDRRVDLPTSDTAMLLMFVATQRFRTPNARSEVRSRWSSVLDAMNSMKAGIARMSPEEREKLSKIRRFGSDGPKMTLEQVEQVVDFPLQSTLMANVRSIAPLLADFDLAFVCTDSQPGFITSDHPCVWFDPIAHQRPLHHRGPALMYPTLEITLPLSPSCLLLMNKRGLRGYFMIPDGSVDELNRRTRAWAEQYFVSRSATAKDIWYERGEAPRDDEIGPSILYN